MKNFVKTLLLGAFVPTFAFSFLKTDNPIDRQADFGNIGKPYKIEVMDTSGNKTGEFSGISSSKDPYEIASSLGANPYREDKFTSFPTLKMNIGSQITIYRSPVFEIIDGKKKISVRSWAENVGSVIDEAKLPELGMDDRINFSLDTRAENGMQIKITRVAKTTVVEQEPIKYTTVKKSNPSVEKGNKKVLQAGVNGVRKKYYAVTREDGVEVSRKLSKTEVASESTDEIIEVGTKVVTYGSGKATWYKRIDKMVAAHNNLPKGTKVKVINTANGKSCVVTIDDRGIRGDAVIDLSSDAFAAIGSLGSGVVNVRIEKYYPE